jgi:hypothetical protein
MDFASLFLVGVLLYCRVGLGRDVPMVAFYVACAAWGLQLVWAPISGSLDWILSALGFAAQYAPPKPLTVVNLVVETLGGFALIAAVLVAARRAVVVVDGAQRAG